MALISEQLPNLMNGVSQQAVTMRMGSQAEKQLNGLSSLVLGNVKRPPSKYITKISDGDSEGAHIHTINRDDEEEYVVFTDASGIRVFSLDGTERSVATPDGLGYISSASNARKDIRALTVADFTFYVNRKVEVTKLPELSEDNGNAALLFTKEAAYSGTYTVTVDDVVQATYTTPAASSGATLSISTIADSIASQLQTNIGSTFDIVAESPVVWIRKKDGSGFTAKYEDEEDGRRVDMIQRDVQRFTDLPVVARDGFIVSITGDDTSAFDEYYLKFNVKADGDLMGKGVWEETVAPAVEHKIDPATMPHVLVRMPDGSFEFRQAEWGSRGVGDDKSAKFPSFVGNKIKSAYFDRRRLCFITRGNVSMSEAGEFFNFMPTTVLQVLDSDRIDVSTSGTEVASLEYAEPFNGKIVFFSAEAQFVIDDSKLLASAPPDLKKIGNYQSAGQAAPVASGRTLFFAVERGDWASVLEYYVLDDTDTMDAAEITEHVPRYIPSPVVVAAASPTANVVLALAATDRSSIWVYKHHWQGNKKLQSSWSQWKFEEAASIQHIAFVEDRCVMVIDYPDGVHIEELSVSAGQYDKGEAYVCRLDRRVDEGRLSEVAYDLQTNTSSFTVPYLLHGAELTVATRSAGDTSDVPAGQSLLVTESVATEEGQRLTVTGDRRLTKMFVGVKYSHEYEFTQAVLKTSSGTGGIATALAGRLQVLRWHVHAMDTGYFRAEVRVRGREDKPFVRHFTGSVLGTKSATLGKVPLRSGLFTFRVNTRAERVSITLVNDSFLPSAFTSAEWEARFTRNTSRV